MLRTKLAPRFGHRYAQLLLTSAWPLKTTKGAVRLAAIPALAYGLWRLRSSANAKGTLAAAARRCGFAQ
jgi:hypothetical protein